MANLILDRADLWPVGTSVSAVASDGTVTESETVASDGKATFTGLTDGARYVLRGTPAGASQAVCLRVHKAQVFVPRSPATWAGVVAARRTALGTS